MDTKTLVVGQYVRVNVNMNKGCSYRCYEAKVVKVTSSGVEVRHDYGQLLQFDSNGCHIGGNVECVPVLVVGQEVYMSSGISGCKGEVVKVTPEGVEVETDHERLLQFDSKGKGLDAMGTYEYGP